MNELHRLARDLLDLGLCVLPAAIDGSKRPAVEWKTYQTRLPTPAELNNWFTNPTHDGLGLVCGNVSGNLEMLELEGRAVAENLPAAIGQRFDDNGLGDLWRRVISGYLEITPAGGMHTFIWVLGAAKPNTKLARRTATDTELAQNPKDRLKVLAETRGEGGWVVIAPSAGRTHPSGQPWQLVAGSPHTIATVTEDERDALHDVLASFDAAPRPEPAAQPINLFGDTAGGLTPGDDFNARATWSQILEPHGWRASGQQGRETFWTRPGKTLGISATTGYGDRGDWLYVFSTSTQFESGTTYTKFAALTLLEHAGDFSAAAAQLRRDGYGGAREPLRLVNGTSAVATQPERSPRPALSVVVAEPPSAGMPDAGLTDVGNAQLLVSAHHESVRFVPERGTWLRWGGSHWSWDDAGHVVELAKATILAIPTTAESVAKHRTRSLSRGAIESMVALARTDPRVVTPAALLDSDPYALCTPGGVVDLHTGQIHDSRPEDLHTRSATVPLEHSPTPRWNAFLHDTFGDDHELRGFVQRLAGLSCTGIVTHHVLPFLHGPGGNGKSVFLDVIRRILGDYAASAPAGFLLAGQQQHETEIARLAGLRFVVCSEVNQESRFDEAKVKLLTGGDALTARFMHQDHFTFTPTHHLWLMGNQQPRITAGGEGFRRRLRLIGFTHTVAEDQKIEGLDRQLVDTEGPGILAWLVSGAQDALRGGLCAPASVLAATQTYMEEEDALGRFVEECCRLGGGAAVRVATAAMRQSYENWCRAEGEHAISPQAFGRELRSRYSLDQLRSSGKRFYVGVSLLSDDEEPDHWSNR